MNSLKTLFIVAVLAAVAYGVYVSTTRKPATDESISTAPGWPGDPLSRPQGFGGGGQQGALSGGVNVHMPGPGAPPTAATESPWSGMIPPPPASIAGNAAGPGGPGTSAHGPMSLTQRGAADGPSEAPSFGAGRTAGADAVGGRGFPDAAPDANPVRPYPAAPDPRYAANVGAGSIPPAPGGAVQPPGGAVDPSARGGSQVAVEAAFRDFMETVKNLLDQGKLSEAHLALSSVYGNPDLPPHLAAEVVLLLDQLAGTVIYSRQHLLELPYVVRPGDTLEQIAQRYSVPPQLLARINGVADSNALRPGQELKVVRGPFSAVVRLGEFSLTLVLHGRYAGRFPIGIGRDAGQLEGAYTVRERIVNPAYRGPDGVDFHSDDPANPLGDLLLDLGDGIALHGTDQPANIGRFAGRGSIAMSPQDIDDVAHILSAGSRVIVEP